METLSHEKKELILDVPFTAEEVGGATVRLKIIGKYQNQMIDGKAFESRWGNSDHFVGEDLECCCKRFL